MCQLSVLIFHVYLCYAVVSVPFELNNVCVLTTTESRAKI